MMTMKCPYTLHTKNQQEQQLRYLPYPSLLLQHAILTLYISHVGQGIIYRSRARSNPGSKWTKYSSLL